MDSINKNGAAAPSESEVQARLEALLGRMSLEEKIGQLTQTGGFSYFQGPTIEDIIRKGGAGAVLWLNHTMREYYDLWDRFQSHLSWKGRIKERTRRALIHRADAYCFKRMERRLVISATVQARFQRWGGVHSDVRYPPPPVREYRCETYEPYIFAVSGLAPLKRFDLLLRVPGWRAQGAAGPNARARPRPAGTGASTSGVHVRAGRATAASSSAATSMAARIARLCAFAGGVVLTPDGVVLLMDAVYRAQLIKRAHESVPIHAKAIPASSISHTKLIFVEGHVSIVNAAWLDRRVLACDDGTI